MSRNRLVPAIAIAATAAIIATGCSNDTSTPDNSAAKSESQTQRFADAPPELVRQIATDAYVWGYPLVMMERTRELATNYSEPRDMINQAPINQFSHSSEFPDETFRAVVRPNFDTLYSTASIDVSAEPVVMTLPATDRYHLFPILDAWTEVVASPGTYTNQGIGGNYLIAGPDWQGDAPSDVEVIRIPTNNAWILGRIQSNGPSDHENVHELQKQVALAPLSDWGDDKAAPIGKVDPAIDMTTPPLETLNAMDGRTFFTTMFETMKKNPPLMHDQMIVERLKMIGLEPGEDLDFDTLPENVQSALNAAPESGTAEIVRSAMTFGTLSNGWMMAPKTLGYYGGDYGFRAAIARIGLGANRPQDAMYPLATKDQAGQPLVGSRGYSLTFAPGQLPPVDAFWSLTMYDEKGFPVANPLNRFALGDRDSLITAPDGSLTLYVGSRTPGADKEANWLPAPDGAFSVNLRFYAPKPALTSGEWSPPPLVPNN